MTEQDQTDFEALDPDGNPNNAAQRPSNNGHHSRRANPAHGGGNGRHPVRDRSGQPAPRHRDLQTPPPGTGTAWSDQAQDEAGLEEPYEAYEDGWMEGEMDDSALFYEETGIDGAGGEDELSLEAFADLLLDGEYSDEESLLPERPGEPNFLDEEPYYEEDLVQRSPGKRSTRRARSRAVHPKTPSKTFAARVMIDAGRLAPDPHAFLHQVRAAPLPTQPDLSASRADLRTDARLMHAIAAAAVGVPRAELAGAYAACLPLLVIRLYPTVEHAMLPLIPGLTAACSAAAAWLHRRPGTRRWIAVLPELLLDVIDEMANLSARGRRLDANLAVKYLARRLASRLNAAGTRSSRAIRQSDPWRGYDHG